MTKVMFVARTLQIALCGVAVYLYGWGGLALVIVAFLLAGLVMVEERLHGRG